MFSFCFSELVACTAINLQDANDFQEYQTVLKLFNNNSDLPPYLKKNMYDITMCEWNYSKRHPLSGESGILSDAPENLKKSILYQRIVDCLLKVSLFQTCDKNILWNLAPLAQLNVVPPGQTLKTHYLHTVESTYIASNNFFCRNNNSEGRHFPKIFKSITQRLLSRGDFDTD